METSHPEVTVQVIIPARNEEDCLARCLESLAGQQGISFRITVVDDGSTDRTRAIAESMAGVEVISAPEPPPGVMGKCNALITGAHGSKAPWLLFTDADTVHYPGSLAAAVQEAEDRGVALLSYSPEQETASWAESALMPLVFADLVRTYPPERVNDPGDPSVAANGQYILVRRADYEALGGHAAVSRSILEDVELARLFKVSGKKIWFRQGAGRVRTRMYRSFNAMWEGWTKNLALLFRHPLLLAVVRGSEFLAVILLLAAAGVAVKHRQPHAAEVAVVLAVMMCLTFLRRILRAHFPWRANIMSFFGLPLFVSLLLRSYLHAKVHGEVTWKGRTYHQSEPGKVVDSSTSRGAS
ncbi:MAG TPA: glycosyltransferase [Candidatus Angelobacter sp.]|nr:glycosyltransferase [Candidatus Angelobacter sp.]